MGNSNPIKTAVNSSVPRGRWDNSCFLPDIRHEVMPGSLEKSMTDVDRLFYIIILGTDISFHISQLANKVR